MEGPKEQVDVLLYDGVTELGLSGLLDPFLGSFSARTFVMAPDRGIVQSRAGFQLLPRYTLGDVPALDRVLVAAGENDAAKHEVVAAWSAIQPGRPVDDLYRNVGNNETAYDVSFQDLAHSRNGVVARVVADTLFFPAEAALFRGAAWPIARSAGTGCAHGA